jgi:putative endopeptidase
LFDLDLGLGLGLVRLSGVDTVIADTSQQHTAPTTHRVRVLFVAFVITAAATPMLAQAPRNARALGIDTANMDRSVRPQDDFFRYVNGRWLQTTQIPGDRASYGAFVELDDKSQAALRTIIDRATSQPAAAGSEQQKVADLFRSYMDTVRIESLGLAPVAPHLDWISQIADRKELAAAFARLLRMGAQTPLAFSVQQDAKQADRYIGIFSQSGLGLPDRDYYLGQDAKLSGARAAYVTYIERVLTLAGQPDPAGSARRILALETRLAESHWDRAKNRDRDLMYNKYALADLSKLSSSLDWTRFLSVAGADAGILNQEERAAGIPSVEAVIISQPDYVQALDRALVETPLEDWRTYLRFKVLSAYAPRLSRSFVDASFDLYGRTLSGTQENRPRWKRGISAVEGALGEAVGRLYVEQYFSQDAKARMDALVRNLVDTFREGIDQLEWMSPATRAQAQAKLAKFNVKIAYPVRWRDYGPLQIRADDLIGNTIRANEFDWDRRVRRIGRRVDRDEWRMTPQTVNAYYSATLNEIVFPAAILQPPFFNVLADDAVNYGAIGAVIGHEISHGFDDQGRKSDGEGNLRDWWGSTDAAAFEERATRLAEQYSAYKPLPDLSVNGRFTLGENIGDLSGVAVAYKAYRRSLNGQEAPVIDGFTGDQRFFMGWAQIWRQLLRDEATRQQLLTDPHSPGQYRVNGVLVNMPEFYAAFGVKEGDGMYVPPSQRVKIW